MELDRAGAASGRIGGDGHIVGHGARYSEAGGALRGARGGLCRAAWHERIWTAALVVIGDEILSGRTQDKNIAQIATLAQRAGHPAGRGARRAPIGTAAIVEAVNALRARNDYLFTTGGIGPTHDDITVDAIAAALGVRGGVPSRGAGGAGTLLRDARRADRGAAAHGARARGRRR